MAVTAVKFPHWDTGGAVHNVRAYGVAGDGTTDDTTAINTLIAVVNAAGGGVLYFPPGTYMVNTATSVQLRDNTDLNLAPGAILAALPTTASTHEVVDAVDKSNIRIFGGGTIQGVRTGPASGEAGHGIRLLGCTDVRVEGVRMVDCWGDGMYVGAGTAAAKNIVVRSCMFDNNRRNGMSVVAANGILIEGNIFQNTNGTAPEYGLDLEPNAPDDIVNAVVIGNISRDNDGGGIMLHRLMGATVSANECYDNGEWGIYLHRVKESTVQGNRVKDCALGGIYCTSNTSAEPARNNVIANNSIADCGAQGVYMNGQAADYMYDNVVQGNTILNAGSHGIELSQARRTVVQGNAIRGSTTEGMRLTGSETVGCVVQGNTVTTSGTHGINVQTSASRNTITGNAVNLNGQHGILLASVNNCTVAANQVYGNGTATDNTYSGITVGGTSTRNNVQGNTINYGAGANREQYGIYITNASATANLVTNNYVETCRTGAIQDSGTSTVTAAANLTF